MRTGDAGANVALHYVKSTKCSIGDCVEVARHDGWYYVRNSQMPTDSVRFSVDEWRAFVEGVKDGEFD